MADVILINPSISDDPVKDSSNLRPPLGLLTIAAPLVQNDYDVMILDQRVENDWQKKLLQGLRKTPFCIGISCMSGNQIKFALRISKFIRNHSSVPIIWGGVHPTLEPRSTASNELVDVVVVGEGDYTFLEIVKAIEADEEIDEIRGIAFKKKNRIILTKQADLVDLNALPKLPFYLINLNRYIQDNRFFGFKSDLIIPLETSRGCSHKCAFCFQSKNPHRWRAQSVQRMISDVEDVVRKYKAKAITFNDDNFFVDCKRVDEFSRKLIEKNINIEWYTSIRPEYVKRITDIKLLERSGLRSLTIGIESGSKKILSLIDKGASTQDFYTANNILKKTGILPLYCAIYGFPYETVDDIKLTYKLMTRLIKQNHRSNIDLLKLIPTPSTKILDLCVQKGFRKPKTLEGWIDVIDFDYDKSAPWVGKKVERWINKHKLFLKLLWLRNDKIIFSETLFGLYSGLILK